MILAPLPLSHRTHLNAACSPSTAAGGGAVLIEHGTSAAGRIKRTRSHRPRPPEGPPRSRKAPLRVLTRRSSTLVVVCHQVGTLRRSSNTGGQQVLRRRDYA